MKIKILPIPGINDRTINREVILSSGKVSDLISLLKESYGIDLESESGFITMLDGKAVNFKKTDLNLENSSEFLIVPYISGG